jgi:hypothetical protein
MKRNPRITRFCRACLGLVMVVPLPACGPVVINASETAQDCAWSAGTSGWCFGLSQWGHTCGSPAGKGITGGEVLNLEGASPLVGWEARWDPGTKPAACKEWLSTASRAYVNFDIFPTLQGKAIIAANLKWSLSSKYKQPGIASNVGHLTACYAALFEATGPWVSFNTPGDFQSDWTWETVEPTGEGGLDVTHVIRRWAKGDQPYFGFFFTSVREDLPYGFNALCETTLDSLRLEVIFKDPP